MLDKEVYDIVHRNKKMAASDGRKNREKNCAAGKEKYQRREKRHFSVIRFTSEGNHKGDNSVSEKSQVGKTIYPRLSGKTQHCE